MSEASAPPAGDGSFSIDSPAFASDQFRINVFKVQRCPRARPHDWTQCPFAHSGEKAKRRDPRRYRYSGTACPDFRKTGACRRADACPFSHGVFECWLHPTRYKTQLCTDGPACRRRVCFFAHTEAELRKPEEYPPLPPVHLPADLGAELALCQQQQQAAAAAQAQAQQVSQQQQQLANLQLLKGLSLGVGGAPNPLLDASAPSTPIGTAIPSAAAAAFQDLSAQAALLQSLGSGAAALQSQRSSDASVLSIRSVGSPTEGDSSPHAAGHAAAAAAAADRGGTPPGEAPGLPVVSPEDAAQIVRLLQQQQQQQQMLGQLSLGGVAAAGLDPALLMALQSLSLGASGSGNLGHLLEANPLLQQQQQQAVDAAASLLQQQAAAAAVAAACLGHRRSIDNGTLARQLPDSMHAAAAEALLGTATPLATSLPSPGATFLSAHLPPLHPSSLAGSLSRAGTPPQGGPSMAQLAEAAAEQALPRPGAHNQLAAFGRSMSFEHILAELPRSASQVNLAQQ